MRTDDTVPKQNTDIYKNFSDLVRRTINLIYRKGSIVFSYKRNNRYSKDYTWYNIDDGWLLGHLTSGGITGDNDSESIKQIEDFKLTMETEGFALTKEYLPSHTHYWTMHKNNGDDAPKHKHLYAAGYPRNAYYWQNDSYSRDYLMAITYDTGNTTDEPYDKDISNNQKHLDNNLPGFDDEGTGNPEPHSHEFEIPTIGMYMYSRLDNYNDDNDIYDNIYATIDSLYPLGAVIISKCTIPFLQTTDARKYWTRITITQDSLIISADSNSTFEVGMEINNNKGAECSFTTTSEVTLTERHMPTHTHTEEPITTSEALFRHTHMDSVDGKYLNRPEYVSSYKDVSSVTKKYSPCFSVDNDKNNRLVFKIGGKDYNTYSYGGCSCSSDNCTKVDSLENDAHALYTSEELNGDHEHNGTTEEWTTQPHAHELTIPVISVYIYIHHIKIHT